MTFEDQARNLAEKIIIDDPKPAWQALVADIAIRKAMYDLVDYLSTAQAPDLGKAVTEARRIHHIIRERK